MIRWLSSYALLIVAVALIAVAQQTLAPSCVTLTVGGLPACNTVMISTHSQIQQAVAIRCSSQNGTNAYTCAPCPLNGACVSGIGPMPVINQMAYGMELQFIADVPCPLPSVNICTLNVDTLGAFSIQANGNGISTAPATFGPGFHRVAADQISGVWVWRLLY